MPWQIRKTSRVWFHVSVSVCCLCALSATAQISGIPEVPSQFEIDVPTASRLKPELMAQRVPATGQYSTGRLLFERLGQETQAANLTPAWPLHMVEDDQLNAYASPDGGVYIDSGLARLVGANAVLWAAVLSHEIAHVVRRHWACRYLFHKGNAGYRPDYVPGVASPVACT